MATEATPPRERVSLNEDWRFHQGDPQWVAPHFNYATLRAWLLPSRQGLLGNPADNTARPPGNLGSDILAVQPGFDDSAWRTVTLPHDWAIEGPFQQQLPGDTGKLPVATAGWYRKRFSLPASDDGRRITLEIDGAMSCPVVWLNGSFVGGWAYGYSSFQLDLTPYAKPGAENVLVVRLENQESASRWYQGAGLYRNVWLTKTEPIHVAQWGTCITTPKVGTAEALVSVEVRTQNNTAQPAELSLSTELFYIEGSGTRSACTVETAAPVVQRIPSFRQTSTTQTLRVANPRLWSISSPQRYVAVTTLKQANRIVDKVETTFGIRTLGFDANKGFLLNGDVVKLHGVCLHHDLGALGAAINTRAIERQLEILRQMGCNAIRTAHNPPAPEFLDACDRLGFLVYNEAFDCWAKGKGRGDYHRFFEDWHEADLRALVRRDRNHPSVFMWSIGNEVVEQWGDDSTEAWRLATRLAGIVREEDRTRPVSNANHAGEMGFNGVQHALDATGFNYRIETYARFRAANPAIPLYGSETAATISSRGEYYFPVSEERTDPKARANFQVSSYCYSAESWASGVEPEWRAADAVPGYAGEFVWSGFDYLGEPQPYLNDATILLNFSSPEARERMAKQLAENGRIAVPSRSSYFGIVDLAGLPKDLYYLYQARWRPDYPMAHLLPHWTWPERVNEITPVHVFTSGDEAELFLNGRSLGRKKRSAGDYRLRWDDVRYEAGELRVVAYKKGAPWAEAKQRTAGAPARIRLSPDRQNIHADGTDLAFITVDITDASGVLVPRADTLLHFSVEGPGTIVATDNGDPTSFEPFQAPQRKAFNGKAVVIIRTRKDKPGTIILKASAEGLQGGQIEIKSTTAGTHP